MKLTAPSERRRPDPSGGRRRERAAAPLAGDLFARRHAFLLAVASKRSINRDDAEDSVQDAFVRFLSRFQPAGPAPALPWLVTTVKHECGSRLRRELRGHPTSLEAGEEQDRAVLLEALPAETDGPAEIAERAEALAAARRRLRALKPAERRALVLIAAGFSYREIQALTGWSRTKINRCASEGRARLREPGKG